MPLPDGDNRRFGTDAHDLLVRYQKKLVESANHLHDIQLLKNENEILKLKFEFVETQLSSEKDKWQKLHVNYQRQIDTLVKQNSELLEQLKAIRTPSSMFSVSNSVDNFDISSILTPEPSTSSEAGDKSLNSDLAVDDIFTRMVLPEPIEIPRNFTFC